MQCHLRYFIFSHTHLRARGKIQQIQSLKYSGLSKITQLLVQFYFKTNFLYFSITRMRVPCENFQKKDIALQNFFGKKVRQFKHDMEYIKYYLHIWFNEQSSFCNLSVTSPTSQLILQPFRRFTYVTAHYPTLPLLHLRHSSFSNPSFASPTSQALHLRHLASRPYIL